MDVAEFAGRVTSRTRTEYGVSLPWEEYEIHGPDVDIPGTWFRLPKGEVVRTGEIFFSLEELTKFAELGTPHRLFSPREKRALLQNGLACWKFGVVAADPLLKRFVDDAWKRLEGVAQG